MAILNLVLSIVALVLAILAYEKAGGVAGLRKQLDQITHPRWSLESRSMFSPQRPGV